MENLLKLGLVGFGCRGMGLLEYTIMPLEGKQITVVGVCDLYEDRTQKAADKVEEMCGRRPLTTQDYREILKMDIDAVVIMSSWESHIEIAVEAMKAGKIVASEVGGAYSIDDCWRLVRTSEETGMPCMLLENCCYGQREMMVLNMVRNGVFGDVVHCSGGYMHDLRQEVADGEENRHYRLRNYLNRNCENYPTHEFGPIAKVLNINNGNRMLSLTSTASRSAGLNTYIKDRKGEDNKYANARFAQGDVVTTVITCAGGETVTITLDTTLPRCYSRGFTVRGTKAAYFEDTDSFFIDHQHNEFEFEPKKLWGNAESFVEEHQHPLWKDYVPEGGHGGMDGLVFRAFVDAARRGTSMPIDVYDMAAYMCITALSEESIAKGGAPVAVPDFTNGKWTCREKMADGIFALDKVKE